MALANKSKKEFFIISSILLLLIINIDNFVIDINFAYYALILGIVFLICGKIEVIIFFTLVFYPIKEMIPRSYNEIFGIINVDDIFFIFLIMLFIRNKKSINFPKQKLDKSSKVAIHFTLFVLFLSLLYYFRNILYFDIVDPVQIVKILGKEVLVTIGIIIIILESKRKATQKIIDNAIFSGVVIMGLSILFSYSFQNVGINIYSKFEQTLEVTRSSGISHLDLNQFSAQMLLIYGYFLSRVEKQIKLKYFIGCGFALVGIFSSGSRFAFIILLFISIIFLLRNRKIKFHKIVIPFIILFATIPLFVNIVALDRIAKFKKNQHLHKTAYDRLDRQTVAIKYIFNNPVVLLIGAKISFAKATLQTRHIHNSYILILFKYGIIPLTIYLILILKMVMLEKKSRSLSYSLIYPMMGFFLPQLSVYYNLFIYFPIIIAMSGSNYKLKTKIDNPPEIKKKIVYNVTS